MPRCAMEVAATSSASRATNFTTGVSSVVPVVPMQIGGMNDRIDDLRADVGDRRRQDAGDQREQRRA